jgi:hypothetical protein
MGTIMMKTPRHLVMNRATILIIFVLMLLAGWAGFIINVNGAFLHRKFEHKHKMYMAVPKGFEKYTSSGGIIASEDSLQDKTSSVTILARFTEDYVEDVLFTKQGRSCLFFK